MGCCLSKTEENQDKMFDPNDCPNQYEEIQETNQNLINEASSFAPATETNFQSGECDYEEPRKARKWVERIETNKDRIVLSVDPEASDEKIVNDREDFLLEYGRSFLLEWEWSIYFYLDFDSTIKTLFIIFDIFYDE